MHVAVLSTSWYCYLASDAVVHCWWCFTYISSAFCFRKHCVFVAVWPYPWVLLPGWWCYFPLLMVFHEHTVGAQSLARAQSIARRHSTYVIMPKKHKFRKFLFGKIKKEEFARRFFKKNSVFSSLKLLNKHCSKMIFIFLSVFCQ